MIYWQVHAILPFQPTINTEMNMIGMMQTEVPQET